MSHGHGEQQHITPTSVYVGVWIALLILTGVTVGVSLFDLRTFTVFTAVIVATVKVTLVLLFFMHLKYERPVFMWMILVVLICYGIAIGLTFADYVFRF